ncbi:hypothetical protein AGATL06_26210 [Agathobaculum sp. TL06]
MRLGASTAIKQADRQDVSKNNGIEICDAAKSDALFIACNATAWA